jgi:hypothetical protein
MVVKSALQILDSECFTQSGAGPVGAGQARVGVDPVRLHAECGQRIAMRGEVLRVGLRRVGLYAEYRLTGG